MDRFRLIPNFAVCVCVSTLLVGASLLAHTPDAGAQAGAPALAPGDAQRRVHVRGIAAIDARAARSGGALLLSGTLKDDLGQALAGDTVEVTLARVQDGAEQVLHFQGDAPDVKPTGCEDPPIESRPPGAGGPPAHASPASGASSANTRAGITLGAGPELGVKVDDAGRFCVRFPLPEGRYAAHLSTHGSRLLDAGKADVALDLAKRSIALRFDPAPRALLIDAAPMSLDAVATIDEDAQGITLAGRTITLQNDQSVPLGTATTNAGGRARFVIDPGKLGAPGPGELRLAYAGDADTSAAAHAAPIERRTHVELALEQGPTADAVAEDGIPIDVHAFVRGAGGKREDAKSGSVEVRLFDQVVGAAPVQGGRAHVVSTFAAPEAATASLVVRYLPDAPWYEPEPPLAVDVPLRGPSPLRQLPLAVAGLAVAAFLAAGRLGRRTIKAAAPRVPKLGPPPAPEARLEVVQAAEPGGPRIWKGRVVDAHHGSPLHDVRVLIEHATFGQREIAASVTTDCAGAFELAPARVEQDARLVAEGPYHTAFRQKLPPAGEVRISLVSRKRALLDRLIAWARLRGRPYDQRPEPTPGHVRASAGSDFGTARWADAVERAAFGAEEVDARAEDEVEKLAPHTAPAAKPRPMKLDLPPAQQTQVNAAASFRSRPKDPR